MGIKFYGQSQEVAGAIVETFKAGNLPEKLAPIWINRNDDLPSSKWSWCNRFVQALSGTADARGFKQWQEAGRKVKKGAKAIYILGPIKRTIARENDQGEEEKIQILAGFKSIPVFRLEDTEVADPQQWEKCGGVDTDEEERLQALPFADVAKSWGLNITSYNGQGSGALGYYSPGSTLAIGVKNLSTWAHELVHAADDKNGTITKKPGQQPDNEIVAEMGGAVLLTLMGEHHEADLGGAWDYIKAYSGGCEDKATRQVMKLIDRICGAVNLIIKDADNLHEAKAA